MTDGKLVGIITLTDLSKAIRTQSQPETLIETLMTPLPVTAKPSDTLVELLHMIEQYQVHHLPVVDDGRFMGLITSANVTQALAKKMMTGEQVE